MTTPMTTPPHRSTQPLPKVSDTPMIPPAGGCDERPLSSDALLQGRKAIAIAHNGATYRLQATRQGKLILTK